MVTECICTQGCGNLASQKVAWAGFSNISGIGGCFCTFLSKISSLPGFPYINSNKHRPCTLYVGCVNSQSGGGISRNLWPALSPNSVYAFCILQSAPRGQPVVRAEQLRAQGGPRRYAHRSPKEDQLRPGRRQRAGDAGCVKFLPGVAWLLLSKTGPPFSASPYFEEFELNKLLFTFLGLR